MRRLHSSVGMGALAAVLLATAMPLAMSREAGAQPSAGLATFASEAELRRFLQRRTVERRMVSAFAAAAPPAAAAQEVVVTGNSRTDSITNTQEAGVDEGGIVKQRGDLLVILRRGRLFTVSTAGGGLRPVDHIDAFPPGVDAGSDWYDEMLVHGDRVIVIGYSYGRGGTEINRFRLSPTGRLAFEDAYHLKSNDYYSSRNYASRLVGSRLVLYTPLYLGYAGGDPLAQLPGVRPWRRGGEKDAFRPIASFRQIYIPQRLKTGAESVDALHTVISCDLGAPRLDCAATGVLGPSSRNFYVSQGAVYVWTAERFSREPGRAPPALLYRMPLDGGRPSAVGARGAPVDQFSFREDAADGVLNVLVRSQSRGDAMWRPEFSEGAVALARIRLSDFGDGAGELPGSRYRALPRPAEDRSFQNRFVGEWLLYGEGESWGERSSKGATLFVAPVRGGPAARLPLPHGVDRIEALGRDALVVGGGDPDLYFTSVELTGRAGPRLGDRYVYREAAEAETRSHAFFFRPDAASPEGASGILGLPVARPARPGYRQLFENSAAMVFLRRDQRRFSPAGELAAAQEGIVDDACSASCADWYGNARPIFLGGRILALLGYELVEGRLGPRGIREVGRVSFAPAASRRSR